jgi:hypothetical protein
MLCASDLPGQDTSPSERLAAHLSECVTQRASRVPAIQLAVRVRLQRAPLCSIVDVTVGIAEAARELRDR